MSIDVPAALVAGSNAFPRLSMDEDYYEDALKQLDTSNEETNRLFLMLNLAEYQVERLQSRVHFLEADIRSLSDENRQQHQQIVKSRAEVGKLTYDVRRERQKSRKLERALEESTTHCKHNNASTTSLCSTRSNGSKMSGSSSVSSGSSGSRHHSLSFFATIREEVTKMRRKLSLFKRS